jgi:hypothetical protein
VVTRLEDVASGFSVEGTEVTCTTVWRGAPQGPLVGRSGRNLAVHEPIKVWPVMRRMGVEKIARSEPEAQ